MHSPNALIMDTAHEQKAVIIGPIVHDNDFEIRDGLVHHGFQSANDCRPAIIQRYHYAK